MLGEKILNLFLKHKAVCTDTRKIIPNAIYFALKGGNFDGNRFALQALNEGCSYAIVDDPSAQVNDKCILVKDVLTSLQELATNYRNHLKDIIIIGLTGSNGKTTTKELMRDVLATKYRVFATHGNLNNHIGVPLSILSIKEDDDFAIIEMGANHLKEIELLATITRPDYGLITNIGKAHLEGFGGIEGVAKGKSELFDHLKANDKKAFVNIDLLWMDTLKEKVNSIDYQSQGGKYQVTITQATPTLSFSCVMSGNSYEISTNFTGDYNIHNLMAALVIGEYFEVEPEKIADALTSYQPENSRSQITKTDKNVLIMDAYNANPTSLENALINLSKMDGLKYFVIGDMLEMGEYSQSVHQDIIKLTQELQLDGIVVGSHFVEAAKNNNIQAFVNNQEAKTFLNRLELENYTILIKGSRGIQLEKVVDVL